MMTRSQFQSPKSKQRSNTFSTFYKNETSDDKITGRKRTKSIEDAPFETAKAPKPSSIGIAQEQLTTLFDRYKSFLIEQKRQGRGPLTRLGNRQNNRSAQIEMLENAFKNVSEQQTFENWKVLLILLVQYRIKVYTENRILKKKSEFGNALWAVQEHLLQALKKAQAANPHCEILAEIMQHIQNETLCSTATAESETKIIKAAFGHYSVLASDYPSLGVVTDAVTILVAKLDQPSAENSLQIVHLYKDSSSMLWDKKGNKQAPDTLPRKATIG